MEILMRRTVFILFFLVFSIAYAVETPQAVKTFHNSVKKLSSLESEHVSNANELQQTIQKCFAAAEHGGINIIEPDIYLVGAYMNKNVTGQRYSIQLKRLIFDNKSLTMDNQNEITKIIMRPAYPKAEPHLYQTTVKKIVCFNGSSATIWQKFNVNISNDATPELITKIVSSKIPFDEKKIIVEKDPNEMTANELLDLAAEYYSKKNKKLAYDTYVKVTQKYETNPDGWLELAIMTYYEEGYSHRDYREKALNYIDKSLKYMTNTKKRQEALRFKMKIEHPNFY